MNMIIDRSGEDKSACGNVLVQDKTISTSFLSLSCRSERIFSLETIFYDDDDRHRLFIDSQVIFFIERNKTSSSV